MIRSVLVILLVVIAAGFGYGYYGPSRPPRLLTVPIERGHVVVVVKATGMVNAKLTVDVSSQLSGRIAEVPVDFNDSVKAGDPIARLDPESYTAKLNAAKAALQVARSTSALNQATVERAKANLASAQANAGMSQAQLAAAQIKHQETLRDLQRKQYLARGANISESDLSRVQSQSRSEEADLRADAEQLAMRQAAIAGAEAELHMAEANVKNSNAVVQQKQAEIEQAEVDLERTVLRAPIDGVILKRDVNPGQTVAVSLEAKTLFKIAKDLHQMQVDARIDEADIGKVKLGQAVSFSVDAYPDKEFAGRVTQIRRSPEVAHNVVTYTAVISADNPDLLLLPGMTATMRIAISDSGVVLKVPNQALRFHPDAGSGEAPTAATAQGGSILWVPGSDGEPKAVAVTLGASDAESTELLDGPLTAGQPVIVGTATGSTRSAFGFRVGF